MTTLLSHISTLILPAALALAGPVVALVLRRTLVSRLLRAAQATATPIDDLVVAALRGPIVLWGALIGLYAAVEVLALPPGVTRLIQKALMVLVIVSGTWALGGIAAGLVRYGAARAEGRLPSATLMSNVARMAVLALGSLIVLQSVGISVTPLITALGVGGLAVGLALQDTLANFFAGIHILTSRQVRPGDYVRLSTGEEGYVQDVTWRYTTVRQLPNNLTIVPNVALASAVITNYYLPDTEVAVPVPVGVSYASDLEHVERVTIDVAREVMREVPGGVSEFDPFIRYNAFGDSSITFSVILRGREVVDQHLIRHEFIMRLHARYRAEGIEIPFPQRTVHLAGDGRGATA